MRLPAVSEDLADSNWRCKASLGLSAARAHWTIAGTKSAAARNRRAAKKRFCVTATSMALVGANDRRCGTRRRERFGVTDTGAFDDGVDGIGGNILEGFGGSAGPADFDGVHFCGGAETKMQAKIVLGEITNAAVHFVELLYAGGVNGVAGTDGRAIAFCADELEKHAVIGGAVSVEKDGRRFADVEDYDVDISGVEDVAESGAATGLERHGLQAGFLGDFVEGAVAIVAVQEHRFFVAGADVDGVDLGIDVSVGDEDIEPGV